MSAPALRIVCTFQSTLSVRRATHVRAGLAHRLNISIHALREESDASRFGGTPWQWRFQSTLSVRRATGRRMGVRRMRMHFNPRSP